MAKYIGPKIKIIRKLGVLPGLTKKNINTRTKTPGQHGRLLDFNNKQFSLADDYRERLVEKQKLRFNYGISEKQLLNYYNSAKKQQGSTGLLLLEALESRLDCIIHRLGFSTTINEGRQFINHGHILVNNKKVNIASFQCRPKDIIQINNNFKIKALIINNINKEQEKYALIKKHTSAINLFKYNFINFLSPHLDLNLNTCTGKILSIINRKFLLLKINELKVVEYYSH